MAHPISSISSPSHPITALLGSSSQSSADTIHDPTHAHVSLISPESLTDDIVVVLKCTGLDSPRCVVESYSNEEGAEEYTDAYALTFVPWFEVPPIEEQEYIFLVDRSGSMGGGKISSVRESLQIMLKSLPSNSTLFNIISFGTTFSSFFPTHSEAYNERSVTEASRHVDSMDANYGGTEILSALRQAVSLKTKTKNKEGDNKQIFTSVFVLTDGESWDLENVIGFVKESVKESEGKLRMFTLGIGNAVSRAMCDGIAHAGNGVSVYVREDQKPHAKLMSLLRAARGVVTEDLTVDWGVDIGDENTTPTREEEGEDFEMVTHPMPSPPAPLAPSQPPTMDTITAAPLSLFNPTAIAPPSNADTEIGPKPITLSLSPPPPIQQAPSNGSIPPMYSGYRTSIFAIVKRGMDGNNAPAKAVKIRGKLLGREVELDVPVTAIPTTTTTSHSKEKPIHVMAARALIQQFEDQRNGGGGMDVKKMEIRRLGLRYGLASSETSFVAVDDEGKEEYCEAEVVKASPVSNGRHRQARRSTGGKAPRKQLATSSARKTMPVAAAFVQKDKKCSVGSRRSKRLRLLPPEATNDEKVDASPAVSSSEARLVSDSEAKASPSVAPLAISQFAKLQSYNGSFTPISFSVLFSGIGNADEIVRKKIPNIFKTETTVWSTLLCVALLQWKFEGEQDVWRDMVEKSIAWVMGEMHWVERKEAMHWLEEASNVLKA